MFYYVYICCRLERIWGILATWWQFALTANCLQLLNLQSTFEWLKVLFLWRCDVRFKEEATFVVETVCSSNPLRWKWRGYLFIHQRCRVIVWILNLCEWSNSCTVISCRSNYGIFRNALRWNWRLTVLSLLSIFHDVTRSSRHTERRIAVSANSFDTQQRPYQLPSAFFACACLSVRVVKTV